MFEPYIKPHGIGSLKFFYATPQAVDWYDPLKPYTRLEYEWVKQNVIISNQNVIDAGCHHGNYSVLFDCANNLYCIDPHDSNCDITWMNLRLNHIRGEVIRCAVANYDGEILFNGQSNGRVGTGTPVVCATLATLCHRATIIKLDVEGAEFAILPAGIDENRHAHTWIVEVHPTDGDPHELVMEFIKRGFVVNKVDRNIMDVVPYAEATPWTSHATIIARRP